MRKLRGITLIEMVMVMIVISIMAAALMPLILVSLRAYDANRADVEVLDKLRYATERLGREIREVNYDSVNGFAFTSTGFGTNAMAFTRTIYDNRSNAYTTTSVSVCTNTDGTAVTLAYSTTCNDSQVLTDKLGSSTDITFSYLDSAGNVLNATTTPPLSNKSVRAVQINLTLTHNGNAYSQKTRVELKNYPNS